jgi:hypothetical protein
MGVYFYFLTKLSLGKIPKGLVFIILGILQIIWVNTHIFFFMGPFLVLIVGSFLCTKLPRIWRIKGYLMFLTAFFLLLVGYGSQFYKVPRQMAYSKRPYFVAGLVSREYAQVLSEIRVLPDHFRLLSVVWSPKTQRYEWEPFGSYHAEKLTYVGDPTLVFFDPEAYAAHRARETIVATILQQANDSSSRIDISVLSDADTCLLVPSSLRARVSSAMVVWSNSEYVLLKPLGIR